MALDFPRAWQLARAAPLEAHHPDCSYTHTNGALLCDLECPVIANSPEYRCSAMHGVGGAVTKESEPYGKCVCHIAVGDRVQVKPEHDETLHLLGMRTTAGTVTAIYEDDVAAIVVELDSGQSVPYRPQELDILPGDRNLLTCPFCDRIERNQYELMTGAAVAFEPLNPVTPGHLLVVPIEHVTDALERPSLTAATMHAAAEIARRHYKSCNLITSVGTAATQTIRHLHIHIVPRRVDDGLPLPWTPQVNPNGV